MVCCSCWMNRTTTTSSNRQQSRQHVRRSSTVMIVKGIFLLLGIGILIPWNAFISATNYFNNRLTTTAATMSSHDIHNINDTVTTTDTTFVSIFAIIFNVSSVLTLGLLISKQSLCNGTTNTNETTNNNNKSTNEHLVLLQLSQQQQIAQDQQSTICNDDKTCNARNIFASQCQNNEYGISRTTEASQTVETGYCHDSNVTTVPNPTTNYASHENNSNTTVEHADTTTRTKSFWLLGIIPFTIYFLVFFVQSIMVLILDIPPNTFLTISILCLALCGSCSVLAQSGIVALAAIFPNSDLAMSPYLEGQAYGGVAVSIANFIASSYSDPSIYWTVHCNNNSTATNTTDIISLASISTIAEWKVQFPMETTVDRIMLTQLSSSTSLYTSIDWGTFVYFLAGSITLLVCLFGFMHVHQISSSYSIVPINDDDTTEQTRGTASILRATNMFEDRYETVRSHDNLDDLMVSSSNDNINCKKRPMSLLKSDDILSSSYNNQTILPSQQQQSEDDDTFLLMQRANSNGFGKGLELKNTLTTKNSTKPVLTVEVDSTTTDIGDGDGIFRTIAVDRRNNASTCNIIVEDDIMHNNDNNKNTTIQVWYFVQGPTICIYMTFVITLALFPGLTSQLASIYQCSRNSSNHTSGSNTMSGLAFLVMERLHNDLYTPMTFVLFNVGDLVGRIVASSLYEKLVERVSHLSYKLVLCSMLRFLFIPLFFLCTTTNDNNKNQHKDDNFSHDHLQSLSLSTSRCWYIPSDLYSLLIQFIFATSNGFLLSMAFIHAPRQLIIPPPRPEPSAQLQPHQIQHNHDSRKSKFTTSSTSNMEMQEKMSELLNFAVSFGLLSGSLLSYPISKAAAA